MIDFSYEWKRGRYKNLTVRVVGPEGRIRVTSPWHLSQRAVEDFLQTRKDWIEQQVHRLQGIAAQEKDLWMVWGTPYRIRRESSKRHPVVVADHSNLTIWVRLPEGSSDELVQRSLIRWRVDDVRMRIQANLGRWERRTLQNVASWTVKTLRSRWGSCRPDRRSIVLNSALGAYPPECLDYVIAHELAHLVHPNHSAEFHALVRHWYPEAEKWRQRLKTSPVFAVNDPDVC